LSTARSATWPSGHLSARVSPTGRRHSPASPSGKASSIALGSAVSPI
jgi:hypothetical protein